MKRMVAMQVIQILLIAIALCAMVGRFLLRQGPGLGEGLEAWLTVVEMITIPILIVVLIILLIRALNKNRQRP